MMRPPPDFPAFAAVVADTFMTSPHQIRPETSALDINGWDSISNATLIVAIEERFGITFTYEEIASFPDLGSMYARAVELAAR